MTRERDSMSDIPSEITREILSWLPSQWVQCCRCVCKEWRRMIDEPSFLKSHTKNQLSSHNLLITMGDGKLYSSPLDSLNLCDLQKPLPMKKLLCRTLPRRRLSWCDGMFLTCIYDKGLWTIWNPLTRQCHEVPYPIPSRALRGRGFGYDSTGDYKVVRIETSVFIEEKITLVYSMKSGCWRRISDCPFNLLTRMHDDGIFLNGALHWRDMDKDAIVVLDLNTEAYESLPMPAMGSYFASSVMALDGCLLSTYCHVNGDRFDGWELMEDRKSWKHLFSLQNFGQWERRMFKPIVTLAYVKARKQLLLQRDSDFFLFNLDNNHVRQLSFGVSGFYMFNHGNNRLRQVNFGVLRDINKFSSWQISPDTSFNI